VETNKPPAKFPLFLHQTGQYAKKVRGRMYYFGTDADKALAKWTHDREYLEKGLPVPAAGVVGCSLRELANKFLDAKKALMSTGELSPRTWRDYYETCERMLETLGKTRTVGSLGATDFDRLRVGLAKNRGPVALGNEIQRVRTIFKYAFEADLIDKPVKFGATFKKPSRKAVRKEKAAAGERMFQAADLRRVIEAAGMPMLAITLLGINCGFGQTDVASLTLDALDLGGGWANLPRPKTGIARRAKLWPETVGAIREALDRRPDPKREEDDRLVFLTKYGRPWVRVVRKHDAKGNETPAGAVDSVRLEFHKLLDTLGIKRERMGYYWLRHTFQTVGGNSKDPDAVSGIMGHADESMASRYRERIEDERLEAVANVVRDWLFKE
jgi:integrase